jgi:hypothetical protein
MINLRDCYSMSCSGLKALGRHATCGRELNTLIQADNQESTDPIMHGSSWIRKFKANKPRKLVSIVHGSPRNFRIRGRGFGWIANLNSAG